MEATLLNDAPVPLLGGWSLVVWAGPAMCRWLPRAQSSKFPVCSGFNTKIFLYLHVKAVTVIPRSYNPSARIKIRS